MSDKDRLIRELIREIGMWKGRALEAAEKACDECERGDCANCRVKRIKEEAVT